MFMGADLSVPPEDAEVPAPVDVLTARDHMVATWVALVGFLLIMAAIVVPYYL